MTNTAKNSGMPLISNSIYSHNQFLMKIQNLNRSCGVFIRLKQDLQDLSDLLEWTSLLPETPVIELPKYLLKLHSNLR